MTRIADRLMKWFRRHHVVTALLICIFYLGTVQQDAFLVTWIRATIILIVVAGIIVLGSRMHHRPASDREDDGDVQLV